jgi:phosphoketolase
LTITVIPILLVTGKPLFGAIDSYQRATLARSRQLLISQYLSALLKPVSANTNTRKRCLLSTYEAFVHVIDSMFNQHAKWLEISQKLSWRSEVASLNLLITSTVWRQDHNGFTHYDPGSIDVVANKSMDVVRIYLPPDVNCLLTIADRCFRSTDRINTIVSDKQPHLQYLTMISPTSPRSRGYDPTIVLRNIV